MSNLVTDLAKVELSDEMLKHLSADSIVKNFKKNYEKLDDLRRFRSDYESKNPFIRWWDNDKLQNAHLDSATAQAEFSKAVGQLILICIDQSKLLVEQQCSLAGQQRDLKQQADLIAEHTGDLQQQHHVMSEQSQKLETLVHEYFSLKGLTEDGVQKLIDIACEVKATRDEIFQKLAEQTKDVELRYRHIASKVELLSAQLASSESALRNQLDAAQQIVSQRVFILEQGQFQLEEGQNIKNSIFKAGLSQLSTKLDRLEAVHQEKLVLIEGELVRQTTHASHVADDLSRVRLELASRIPTSPRYE